MKISNLLWVLALASAVAACNNWTDQPPVEGIVKPPVGGTGGTAGTGGTGGTGGVGEGACTNEADQAVYASLTYTDEAGITYTGTEAASAIGSDCIFGTETSNPVLAGCGDEAFAVLGCFPNCPSATTQALADCVASCTQTATGLSAGCMACTGATVACGAAYCTNFCVSDTNAPQCVGCRCDSGCTPNFDKCSGLPSTGECN